LFSGGWDCAPEGQPTVRVSNEFDGVECNSLVYRNLKEGEEVKHNEKQLVSTT
jgi:hypothetical protein